MNLLNDIINRIMENCENKGSGIDEGALRANVLKLLVESSELSRQVNRGRLDLLVRHFSEVMKMDFDFYVGDTYEEDSNAHRPSLPIDTACFGDYYFDIFDIQTVVENLNYWYERYGSIEAIRQEVIDWYDYVYDPETKDVNLFHWLSGCPRSEKGGKDGSD